MTMWFIINYICCKNDQCTNKYTFLNIGLSIQHLCGTLCQMFMCVTALFKFSCDRSEQLFTQYHEQTGLRSVTLILYFTTAVYLIASPCLKFYKKEIRMATRNPLSEYSFESPSSCNLNSYSSTW